MLLRFGHEWQSEVGQKLASFRKIGALGIEVSLEGVGTGLVDGRQSFQAGVDIVNAEIYVELKLKSLPRFISICKVLACHFEKLLSVSLLESLQDVVFVSFPTRGRLGELHPRLQVRPLIFKSFACAEVAQRLQVLFDHVEQMLILFEIRIGLVFFIDRPQRRLLNHSYVLFDIAYIGRLRLRWLFVHRLLLIF